MAKIIYGPLLSSGREKWIRDCAHRLEPGGARFAYIVPTHQLQRTVRLEITEQLKQGRDVWASPLPPVYLFDGFVNELLKDVAAYQPPIRSDQQKLILRDAANRLDENGRLSLLHDLTGFEGFYLSLLNWLTEVQGAGISPEDWLAGARSDKERELGWIYQAYEKFLDDHQLADPARGYAEIIRRLEGEEAGRPAGKFAMLEQVVIDGFYQLNQLQLRLVKSLMQWGKEVVVHVFLETERRELFLSAWEMVAMLEALSVPGESWVREDAGMPDEERPEGLRRFCTGLFQLTAEPAACDASVQILHTSDPYQEIEVIGREIKQMLLEEESLRFGDIAVVLRNVEAAHFDIDTVFRELGIPYEMALGTPLAATPVFRLVMKMYRIFAEDWSRESVLEVLKSPYLLLAGDGVAERWEERVLEAGIIGGEGDWLRKLERLRVRLEREAAVGPQRDENGDANGDENGDATRDENRDANGDVEWDAVDEITHLERMLREFFLWLKKLNRAQTLFEHSTTLLEFFARYGLDRQIVGTRDFRLLRRDLLSLHCLEELLEELVYFGELFSADGSRGRKLHPSEFLQDLQAGAEVSLIPEPEAGFDAVRILTPSQSRGCRFRRVFIGGLLEGEFPRYGQRDWLFRPEERKALKERGFYFQQAYERLEEERLFFLEAACAATESLILSTPVLPGDERGRSSSFIHEIKNLFTDESLTVREAVPERVWRNDGRPRRALTRREVDENLLREMWESRDRGGIPLPDDEPGKPLLRDLLERGEMVREREGEQYGKYDGLLEQTEIRAGLHRRYHADRIYSISQINEYAVCPFQFYCKRILRLERVEEPALRLEPLDLGNIYHLILFRFFRDFPGWEEEAIAAARTRLRTIADGILSGHPAAFALPGGLWTAYCEEIREYLERIIVFEYAEAARQGYMLKPRYLEASFGLQQDLQETGTLNHPAPVIITRTAEEEGQDGMRVRFSGKIDRMDLTDDGRYLIIYDYKFGSRDGLDEMEAGIDLQLPIYVKAARLLAGEEAEVLGAGYFSIRRCDRRSGIWRDLQPDLVPVTGRSKNYLNGEEWERLLAKADQYVIDYVRRIRAGDFRVHPAKCPKYCKFSKICRFEHARLQRKRADEAVDVSSGSE